MAQPGSAPRTHWPALVRVALVIALAVALLELAWVGLFDWAARTGRLETWLNQRPEKVQVSFRAASSRWLGLIEVTGLTVRGRTARGIDWQVEAESARLQMAFLPLALRRVVVRSADVAAVSVRSRRPPRDGGDPSPHAPELPPMRVDAAAETDGSAVPARPARARRTSRWTFDFRHLRVDGVRELSLDEFGFAGELAGEVGFTMRTRSGEAEIHASRLELADVAVSHRGEVVARDLDGTLELSLDTYLYKEERGRALVPHASGRIVLDGELDERPLVAEMLRAAPWLEIDAGVTPLEADLRLRRGTLLPGSWLRSPGRTRHVCALDFTIDGVSSLELAVGGTGGPSEEAHWRLRFDDYELRRQGIAAPLLVGSGLAVGGISDDGSLADFADRAALRLELGEARLSNLAFLADFLPPGARIEELRGSGVVRGSLDATVADRRPTGTIHAALDDVGVRWGGNDFSGRVEADLVVAGGDLDARWLELDGSKLLLADFAAPLLATDTGGETQRWWLHLTLPEGGLGLGPPVTFRGSFEARLKDTAPLVALFETRRDLPGWAERLLTEEDVRASGSLEAATGELHLERFDTDLFGGRLSMRMRFAGDDRRGKLLLAWRRVALGAGFDGARREIRIDDAKEWFAAD